jgi:alpha-L-arabinofuranosidase
MEGAVYASRMMNGFERDGDVVEANCISDLLNGWIGGIIQASRDGIYGTPQYYAVKMYSHALGSQRLRANIDSPELQPGVSSVDAVVTRMTDGSRIFVKLSNADKVRAIRTNIDLGGFAYARSVNETLLSSRYPMLRNTFSNPRAVHPMKQTISCLGVCTINMPPDSVAVVTFYSLKMK